VRGRGGVGQDARCPIASCGGGLQLVATMEKGGPGHGRATPAAAPPPRFIATYEKKRRLDALRAGARITSVW